MNNSPLPIIKRTRDFHIIDSKGNKYVDFSVAESGAVFGHRYLKIHKTMKQAFDKGLEGNYHTWEKERAVKHIQNCLKGWKLHAIIHTAFSTLLQHPIVKKLQIKTVEDLLLVQDLTHAESTAVLYRFYSGIDRHILSKSHIQYLLVVLPIEWGQATIAILEKTEIDIHICNVYVEPSPILLAGINYIIPKIMEHAQEARPFAVQTKNRVDVHIIDPFISSVRTPYKSARLDIPLTWQQKGIYVILPRYSYEEYHALWQEFLSFGFYLPYATEFYIPRIFSIPTYMTKHELSNWDKAIDTVGHTR